MGTSIANNMVKRKLNEPTMKRKTNTLKNKRGSVYAFMMSLFTTQGKQGHF